MSTTLERVGVLTLGNNNSSADAVSDDLLKWSIQLGVPVSVSGMIRTSFMLFGFYVSMQGLEPLEQQLT